jgi:hypothetical protein
MKTVVSVLLWGCLLGSPSSLNAAVLWDGLLEPQPRASSAVSVSGGTTLGLDVSLDHTSRASSLQGYVGMPVGPVIGGMPPPLPTVTFSLWEGNTLVTSDVPLLTGFGLLGSPWTTESGLRVWSVACDLENLGWVLGAGRSYVIGVSLDADAEWLVRDPVLARSMVNRGGGWEELNSNLDWNVRLTVTPMPEPAGMGAVLSLLLVFGVLRRCCSRCKTAAG